MLAHRVVPSITMYRSSRHSGLRWTGETGGRGGPADLGTVAPFDAGRVGGDADGRAGEQRPNHGLDIRPACVPSVCTVGPALRAGARARRGRPTNLPPETGSARATHQPIGPGKERF